MRSLHGDITASKLLAGGIDSRSDSTSPLWFCPCGGMGSAGRCDVPTPPWPVGRALAPHLQGDLLSFLSCSQKDSWPWLLRFLSFPIHPQGCRPTPSQPPHAHQRAMARPADKGVFLPSGSLHLINSQPQPDWLRQKRSKAPAPAPQIQSELCAAFAHVRPITEARAAQKSQRTKYQRAPTQQLPSHRIKIISGHTMDSR